MSGTSGAASILRYNLIVSSTRRDFLAAAAPLCCLSQPASDGSWSLRDGLLSIDLAREPQLRQVGQPRTFYDASRKLNILLVQHTKGRWAALDRTCTHGGAMCAYQAKSHTLRCTSLNHAEYSLDGRLLHGRTHGDLRAYSVTLRGNQLEVALEARS